ncbi:HNH endonuclease [Paraburkholderia ginsengisoli]|uniref:HNH endonuclease n=1 Tax=Paraburkholderia ginsengisoli TaxID=311231 RepID=A0A7T4N9V1_9BURK|nr:HNH endonuclease [Paraburkholderia ginsengisoli]QQC67876.1 HNH endonuclease [Paraburkholderia ginsengisoli]
MTLAIPLDSLFQRNAVADWDDVHPMFGDVICSLDGQIAFRGDYPEPFARPPAVIDNSRTVTGDLIPETAWGASLANLLVPGSWAAMRAPVIEQNHRVCELCGLQINALEVHEVWEYDFPSDDEMARRDELTVFGVQRLRGLMSVCPDCHLCFHPGYANAHGRLSETLDRLAALNNWSREEVELYDRTLIERWERASQIHWMLDFAGIEHPDGGLTVTRSWRPHPEDARFLVYTNRSGAENVTALLNIPWRISGEKDWQPARSEQSMF